MAELNNEYSSREIVNYQVSGAKKKLYHASKEPKDGYVKIELDSGKVTYHRYVQGLTGKMIKVVFNDGDFGKRLRFLLTDDTQTSAVDLVLDTAAYRAFIDAMYNADFSKELAIKFYDKKVQDKVYQNCFVYYPNDTIIEAGKEKNVTPNRLDNSDCPKGKLSKAGKWTFTEQEEWYYEKAEELISRFEKFKLASKFDPKSIEKPVEKAKVSESHSEDVPF